MVGRGSLVAGDNCGWQLGDALGEGRHGSVVIAYDDSGHKAALKCLHEEFAQNERAVRRFLRELVALTSLCHSAFPRILDQGVMQDGTPFFAMEYLQGATLESRRQCAGGRLDVPLVLDVAVQALEGLSHAHECGLLHRDVTPQNIFLTTAGQVKLLDFGLCYALELSGCTASITGSGVLGTPGFMAPEQSLAERGKPDARADLYSLGATLFVALTGEPVLSETLHGQAVAAPEFQSRSLGAARPDLDSWLINWIDRALAFEPDARWPSAAAMLDWLQKHCGGRRSAEAAAPIAQWKPNIALVELDTLDDTETPPSSQTKRLALQLVRSPEASGQRSIELVPGSEIILGRDQSLSTWCIRDERVSRCHAAVRWDNDAKDYLIVDRSSKNGINVNGTRINAAHLAPGDVIRAGESLIVVIDKQRQSAFQQAVEFASRSSVAVLLHGETGVGKERLAREVHRRSGRRGSFIAVDCAALSTNLAAGEPFGRGLGAFLAAPNSGFSLIHEAEQGTLFLDNINELPIELQPAVSQILRERTDGAKRAEPFDVRIIAATTVPIEERVRHGQFRLDLYARLQAFNVHLPPLRERREQILTTLTDLATSQRQSIPVDCDAAEAILLNHWPTNVCGLQQLLHEVLARGHADSVLDIRALREYAPDLVQNWRALQGRRCSASRQMPAAKDILKERFALQQCIEENDGNISRVAKSLGVTRTQVYRWMNRLGIKASPRPIRAGK